ncbi:DoxX family protein [Aeromicrobium fastidiosum]|uniref:DoxX family protein n=1 Tax=Aeromicrobium fastidiosum TaxID=52699 RepID=UPI002023273A|nr:DoxX family protein [Aeromicrobium fastidiosum]MCL8253209.1 DoxX family protein [Aeromicrobium fastidiosum]
MTLLRTVARPMLASIFVVGGAAALREPGARAAKAQPVADRISGLVPRLSLDGAGLTRLNGGVQLVAGLALASGHVPRTAALALAVSLPPTTVAGHPYWTETDPAARAAQRIHFLKNLSITGGLLMATLDPEPHKRSVGRRAKDRLDHLRG